MTATDEAMKALATETAEKAGNAVAVWCHLPPYSRLAHMVAQLLLDPILDALRAQDRAAVDRINRAMYARHGEAVERDVAVIPHKGRVE